MYVARMLGQDHERLVVHRRISLVLLVRRRRRRLLVRGAHVVVLPSSRARSSSWKSGL